MDQVIFTQVRKPTIEHVSDVIGLPHEKAHTIMEECGYTGSACIPMAFDDAIRKGKINAGDLVVMIGSGVGYNQAACAIRMTDKLVRGLNGKPCPARTANPAGTSPAGFFCAHTCRPCNRARRQPPPHSVLALGAGRLPLGRRSWGRLGAGLGLCR